MALVEQSSHINHITGRAPGQVTVGHWCLETDSADVTVGEWCIEAAKAERSYEGSLNSSRAVGTR
jgi:hypothetical protein